MVLHPLSYASAALKRYMFNNLQYSRKESPQLRRHSSTSDETPIFSLLGFTNLWFRFVNTVGLVLRSHIDYQYRPRTKQGTNMPGCVLVM